MNDLMSHLRQSGQAQLRQQASERIKERLLREFASLPLEPKLPAATSRRFQVERLLARPFAFSVVSLVLVILVAVISAEADAAKPGDVLYALDRGLERVRLTFTISADSRATFQVKLKNERAAEQAALHAVRKQPKQNQPSEAADNDQSKNQPLERAQEVIAQQQDIHAADERGNSGAALEQVEEKLAENQERQAERKNENNNTATPDSNKRTDTTSQSIAKLTKAEVRVRGGVATIQLRHDGEISTFTMPWTNVKNTVREIASRTGVTEENVRRVLRVRRFGSDTNVLVTPKDRPLSLLEARQHLRQVPLPAKDVIPSRP